MAYPRNKLPALLMHTQTIVRTSLLYVSSASRILFAFLPTAVCYSQHHLEVPFDTRGLLCRTLHTHGKIVPLPQSPPHSLLCPGNAEDGRNCPLQHSFSRPVSTHTSSPPATWSLYPSHHPVEASSEIAASLLKGSKYRSS